MAKRLIAIGVVFVLLFGVCIVTVDLLSEQKSDAELQLISDAVRHAAVTCYAVEGAYPLDIEYLRSYYGLQYDENRYIVVYDAFATNLMPDIQVLERGGNAS